MPATLIDRGTLMGPRMLIVLDGGEIKHILTAGGMDGGIVIATSDEDGHPGVSPKRIDQNLFSVARLVHGVDWAEDTLSVLDGVVETVRGRGLFGFGGEVSNEGAVREILGKALGEAIEDKIAPPTLEIELIPPEPEAIVPPEPAAEPVAPLESEEVPAAPLDTPVDAV